MCCCHTLKILADAGNQIDYLVDNTEHLLELLNHGELDFVVVEGIFDKQHYDWMLFQNEPYIGICAKDHPFAGRRIGVEALLRECIILREKGSGTRRIFEWELENSGYTVASFARKITISSFEIIKELVRDGFGVSFLYEAVVKGRADLAQFTCPPLTGTHEFNVVYLKTQEPEKLRSIFWRSRNTPGAFPTDEQARQTLAICADM